MTADSLILDTWNPQGALQNYTESGKSVSLGEDELSSISHGFNSHAWYTVWHFIQSVWSFIVIITSNYALATFDPYFTDTSIFWNYSNATVKNSRIPLHLRGIYLTQMGYYIVDMIDLLFFDKNDHTYKSSTWIIMVHHISALTLLFALKSLSS